MAESFWTGWLSLPEKHGQPLLSGLPHSLLILGWRKFYTGGDMPSLHHVPCPAPLDFGLSVRWGFLTTIVFPAADLPTTPLAGHPCQVLEAWQLPALHRNTDQSNPAQVHPIVFRKIYSQLILHVIAALM